MWINLQLQLENNGINNKEFNNNNDVTDVCLDELRNWTNRYLSWDPENVLAREFSTYFGNKSKEEKINGLHDLLRLLFRVFYQGISLEHYIYHKDEDLKRYVTRKLESFVPEIFFTNYLSSHRNEAINRFAHTYGFH